MRGSDYSFRDRRRGSRSGRDSGGNVRTVRNTERCCSHSGGRNELEPNSHERTCGNPNYGTYCGGNSDCLATELGPDRATGYSYADARGVGQRHVPCREERRCQRDSTHDPGRGVHDPGDVQQRAKHSAGPWPEDRRRLWPRDVDLEDRADHRVRHISGRRDLHFAERSACDGARHLYGAMSCAVPLSETNSPR